MGDMPTLSHWESTSFLCIYVCLVDISWSAAASLMMFMASRAVLLLRKTCLRAFQGSLLLRSLHAA